MGANIPLPALSVRPPEQGPSPMANLAQLLQVKSLQNSQQLQQQQIQAGTLENQQREQALNDQQAITKAMTEWGGKNLDELPGLVLKHGGSGQTVIGLRDKLVEQKKNLLSLDEGTFNLQAKKNDMLLGTLQGVTSGPDEGIHDRLATAAQNAV